jgi:hypothetical protein
MKKKPAQAGFFVSGGIEQWPHAAMAKRRNDGTL